MQLFIQNVKTFLLYQLHNVLVLNQLVVSTLCGVTYYKKLIVAALTLSLLSFSASSYALSPEYSVCVGDRNAPVKIREYFSFSCPTCVELFNAEFSTIREEFIKTGKVYWEFHPIPMDLLTVQGMECLRNLDPTEKEIFLEAIFQEIRGENGVTGALLMQKAMEFLNKPQPSLQDHKTIENSKAFKDAFEFVKSDRGVKAVPTIEVNGVLQMELPTRSFLKQVLRKTGSV